MFSVSLILARQLIATLNKDDRTPKPTPPKRPTATNVRANRLDSPLNWRVSGSISQTSIANTLRIHWPIRILSSGIYRREVSTPAHWAAVREVWGNLFPPAIPRSKGKVQGNRLGSKRFVRWGSRKESNQ